MTDYGPIHQQIVLLTQAFTPARLRGALGRILRGLKQRQRQRIAAQQNPDGSAYEPRRPRQQMRKGKRVTVKSRASMFRKLRGMMSTRVDGTGGHIRFRGPGARIAAIHHFGLPDAVEKGGPIYDYPARQLLGYSDDDREWLADQLAQLSGVQA